MLSRCSRQLLTAVLGMIILAISPAHAAPSPLDAKPSAATTVTPATPPSQPDASIAPANSAAKVMEKAKQMMADGLPSMAYQLLEPHEFAQAGDIDFDYLIGIAALDSGKADKASLALERVLARDPNLAGARLDMARAWYVLGDYARARLELQILSKQNPPSSALGMIKQLQNAIDGSEEEAKRSHKWSAYLESGIGFDDNVTSVVSDFSDAIEKTYNLPGFEPTGSSIKRSSPIAFVQGGGDFSQRFNEQWSMDVSLDAKWRGLTRSQAYSSELFDTRAALQYKSGSYKWRFGLSMQQYWQETELPTANHRSRGFFLQWQKSVNSDNHLSLTLSANRQHYYDIPNNDGDSYTANLSWHHQFKGDWRPSLNLSLSKNLDDAKYLLFNGANNDKDSVGLRAFVQISPSEKIDLFGSIGISHRKDHDTYAHSPLVEYGIDNMSDLSLGLTWHFKPAWSLRTQWNYSRNDSNIAINQYRRNEVTAALRFDFP